MDPEKIEANASGESTPPIPPPNSTPQPLVSAEMTEKLSSMASDPRVGKYLGRATKVVVACAISGSILLVVAILAVVNLLDQVTSAIHP